VKLTLTREDGNWESVCFSKDDVYQLLPVFLRYCDLEKNKNALIALFKELTDQELLGFLGELLAARAKSAELRRWAKEGK
jgi:hypothetical protein